jgi:DNA-binding transcriptional LysR family regulator
MLDLNDFYYFVQVVDRKGFAAAGRALGLPKSSLSRRVIELEARLGVRLIQRTSRSFVVTDVGLEFYRHARAMLVEAEAAESAVRQRLAEPSGTVRFTCAVAMAQSGVAELVPRFMARFPKVELVQHATNRYVDLVDEGFDVGLRGHSEPLPASSLIQRPLAAMPWHLFAGPAYLERAGTPETPAELASHAGLALGYRAEETAWRLSDAGGGTAVVPFTPRLRSDDMLTLIKAAEAGIGIVALPSPLCRAEIRAGTLRRVLPDWIAGDARTTLLIPSRRFLLPAVRAFVDFFVAEFPLAVAG